MSIQGLHKAMILAAGFGTRLKPLTDKMPKALVPYKGKPMIAGVIEKLKSAGITDIVINTHYLRTQVEEFFAKNDFGVNINLVHEPEILGTGGAIKNARKFLENADDFIVYNVDVDCDIDIKEFYKFHIKKSNLVTLAVKKRNTARPLLVDKNNMLAGRVINGKQIVSSTEVSELSETAFCGIHILSKKIFNYFPNENNFDVISMYLNVENPNKMIGCFDINSCFWMDLGSIQNLK